MRTLARARRQPSARCCSLRLTYTRCSLYNICSVVQRVTITVRVCICRMLYALCVVIGARGRVRMRADFHNVLCQHISCARPGSCHCCCRSACNGCRRRRRHDSAPSSSVTPAYHAHTTHTHAHTHGCCTTPHVHVHLNNNIAGRRRPVDAPLPSRCCRRRAVQKQDDDDDDNDNGDADVRCSGGHICVGAKCGVSQYLYVNVPGARQPSSIVAAAANCKLRY